MWTVVENGRATEREKDKNEADQRVDLENEHTFVHTLSD